MSVASSAHRLAYTIPVFSETKLLDCPWSINLSLVKYFSIKEGSGGRYFGYAHFTGSEEPEKLMVCAGDSSVEIEAEIRRLCGCK